MAAFVIRTDATDGPYGYFAGVSRDVFVMLSHRPPSPRTLDLLDQDLARFCAMRKGQGVVLHYSTIGEGFELPSEDARLGTQRVASRWVDQLSATAFVVDIDGFSGAAIRGLFSGVVFALRARTPAKVLASSDEALRWYASLGKTNLPTEDQLSALISELSGASLRALRAHLEANALAQR